MSASFAEWLMVGVMLGEDVGVRNGVGVDVSGVAVGRGVDVGIAIDVGDGVDVTVGGEIGAIAAVKGLD